MSRRFHQNSSSAITCTRGGKGAIKGKEESRGETRESFASGTETASTGKKERAKERGENSPTVDERKLYAESVSPVETGFL